MTGGGIAQVGDGRGESLHLSLPASQCRFNKRIIKKQDFNFDGYLDEVAVNRPDPKYCKNSVSAYSTITFNPRQDIRLPSWQLEEIVSSIRPFSQNFRHFRLSDGGFTVSAKKDGKPFKVGNEVNVPFGPQGDKTFAAFIRSFIFEVDSKFRLVRTLAEITNGSEVDYFELSALTFVGSD